MRQLLVAYNGTTLKLYENGTEKNDEIVKYVPYTIQDEKGHVIPIMFTDDTRVTFSSYKEGNPSTICITPAEGASVIEDSDYTVILVKKGVPFNERNKWTATVRATALDTIDTIVTKLAKYFNDNADSLGITVTNEDGEIYIQSHNTPYTAYVTDSAANWLIDVESEYTEEEFGYSWFKDAISKAAADSGFEYTNNDGSVDKIYPGMNEYEDALAKVFDDNKSNLSVVTIFCNEPRLAAKPLDQSINQVIQLVKLGGEIEAGLRNVLAGYSGNNTTPLGLQ